MRNLIDYIFPYRCLGCSRILPSAKTYLCINCLENLRYTHFELGRENALLTRLQYICGADAAASLLFFSFDSTEQRLIHANKYFNQPGIGNFMGELSVDSVRNFEADVIIAADGE